MKSNEKNFIERLQRQKEDALEYVVDHYLPLIKGIIHKVLGPLGNDGIMEECMNDIFLAIWNHSKKFTGDVTGFRKWVCAIAKFQAIDYYRKAVKKTEIASVALDVDPSKSIEEELLFLEDKMELIGLINQLEQPDRDIFVMKFYLGLKTEDIAQKLGMTRASIDNRIYRGKKKLNHQAANLNLGGNMA